jgi:hypothetical protein
MTHFRNIIILMVIILSASGCKNMLKPNPPSMSWMWDGPPPRKDGEPYNQLYIDGWKDGCETGADASTTTFYRSFLTFRQDPIKAQDPVYYKGWKDSFNYCGRYLYQYKYRRDY